MSKKNNGDKATSVSKEFLSTFTLITNDNIKDFFYNPSIFIIVLVEKKIISLLNNFVVRPRHTKGLRYRFSFVWDNNILSLIISVKGDSESEEDYLNDIEQTKIIIRNEIKSRRLYARKL